MEDLVYRPLMLPYAHGGPAGQGQMKSEFEDFVVEESLSFACAGEGEHVYLQVKKRGRNTEEVAQKLAKFAGIKRSDIGFAGMKDKQAVAAQWFSLRMPKQRDCDWNRCADDGYEVITADRHTRKLKKGAISGNHFRIRIRSLKVCKESLEAILYRIATVGVPNYFGPQRFGRDGRNVVAAGQYFTQQAAPIGRFRRGLLLSAARSFIFNQILAIRVQNGSWNHAISGDSLMFEGSKAYFTTGSTTDAEAQRVVSGELNPTGVLWGKSGSDASADALDLESRVLGNFNILCTGLERCGVESGRRSLRLLVRDFNWYYEDQANLVLEFALSPGGYATSVIRELIHDPE